MFDVGSDQRCCRQMLFFDMQHLTIHFVAPCDAALLFYDAPSIVRDLANTPVRASVGTQCHCQHYDTMLSSSIGRGLHWRSGLSQFLHNACAKTAFALYASDAALTDETLGL